MVDKSMNRGHHSAVESGGRNHWESIQLDSSPEGHESIRSQTVSAMKLMVSYDT
jgi:hypothetical protein